MRPRLLLIALMLGVAIAPAADREVKIGTTVDDPRFKDIRYLARSLADFGDKKAFVLVFVDSDCPLAQKYLPVLDRLERGYRDKGVQFIAVNSGPHDTIVAMAAQAVEFGVEFPFVKDADCRVADALGVTLTPEVAVLDGKRVLLYRGRIDDQYRPGGQRAEPSRHDLVQAIDALLAGKPVEVATTPADGCLISRPVANATDKPVTFADHVAPILQKHCQSCHRPNTPAPFALLTYEQAKAKARTIAEVVSEGRMPPWFAPKRDGDLISHKSLSAAERETVARWAATGLARGDDSKLPKPPEASTEKWRIGEPDLVLTSTPFELPKEGDIPYRYIIFPHTFTEDTWVQGVQILPDVPRAVHHANLVHYKLGESFKESNFITGVVPGGEPMTVDGGVAYLIPKGSLLALQVHYVPTGKAEKVTIRVGLKYASGKVERRLRNMLFVDTKYSIPPGAPAHPVKVERTLSADIVGIGLFAHMHVRGKAMSFSARTPDGKTEKLLIIPNYNFEWQIPYRWEPGKKVLPKGTRLECVALYDNSPFNPYNPDPTKTVKDGPQTYHEMMNGFLFYIEANEKLDLQIDGKTGRVVPKPSGG
ncbi:MAG TPA: redoxin family protein [Gemmataceae bacterium]|nr:redoxin family protein [Gemmataceae bacterium]